MCMDLNKEKTRSIKKEKKVRFRKNKDGMIIAYKWVTENLKSPYGAYSRKKGRSWRVGLMQSSRTQKRLTRHEVKQGAVNEGYHVCASVKQLRPCVAGHHKIIRVLVDPNDVVAEGTFCGLLMLVCLKCTVESVAPLYN